MGEVLDLIYGYFEGFLRELEESGEVKIKRVFVDKDKFDANDGIYDDDDEKEVASWKDNQAQKDLNAYEREMKKIKTNEM